jgi:hypothetical protein
VLSEQPLFMPHTAVRATKQTIRKISEHRWDAGVKSDLHCVRLVIAKHSPERILEGELPIEALEKNHGKDNDTAQ